MGPESSSTVIIHRLSEKYHIDDVDNHQKLNSDDDNSSLEVTEMAQKCEEKYSFLIHWVNRNYIHGTEANVVENLIQMVEALDCCN